MDLDRLIDAANDLWNEAASQVLNATTSPFLRKSLEAMLEDMELDADLLNAIVAIYPETAALIADWRKVDKVLKALE